jgi:hypothetical protein
MKTMNALRNPLVTIPLGIALGAGAAFGAVAATRGGETPAVQEAAPAPGAAEQLDEKLRISSLVGVVATNWEACPDVSGATKLAPEMRVGGWVLPNTDPKPEDMGFDDESRTPFWSIKEVTRYADGGRIIAWCGVAEPSQSNREPYVQEPLAGTIVLIPNGNTGPECTNPESGKLLPEGCMGAPFEYDPTPKQGPLELEMPGSGGAPDAIQA